MTLEHSTVLTDGQYETLLTKLFSYVAHNRWDDAQAVFDELRLNWEAEPCKGGCGQRNGKCNCIAELAA